MDTEELRNLDVATLDEMLITLLKEHFELRMQRSSSQLKNFNKLGEKKRSIAQVKTIIREKQL